jgi:hypothetical protein
MTWAAEYHQATEDQAKFAAGSTSPLVTIQQAKVDDLVEALNRVLDTEERERPISPRLLAECFTHYCPRELARTAKNDLSATAVTYLFDLLLR